MAIYITDINKYKPVSYVIWGFEHVSVDDIKVEKKENKRKNIYLN